MKNKTNKFVLTIGIFTMLFSCKNTTDKKDNQVQNVQEIVCLIFHFLLFFLVPKFAF